MALFLRLFFLLTSGLAMENEYEENWRNIWKRADELANKGREKDQSETPVTQAIVKAKIKAGNCFPTHTGAKEMYRERRRPKFEIESKWTRRMRSLFARLRSNHAKELAYYQHKIGNISHRTA